MRVNYKTHQYLSSKEFDAFVLDEATPSKKPIARRLLFTKRQLWFLFGYCVKHRLTFSSLVYQIIMNRYGHCSRLHLKTRLLPHHKAKAHKVAKQWDTSLNAVISDTSVKDDEYVRVSVLLRVETWRYVLDQLEQFEKAGQGVSMSQWFRESVEKFLVLEWSKTPQGQALASLRWVDQDTDAGGEDCTPMDVAVLQTA